MSAVRIGSKVETSGVWADAQGVRRQAQALEAAGFDSLWVSDHILQPRSIESAYPFSADGRATWSTEVAYLDAVVALGVLAALTERVELGSAILVLPLRQPLVLAKQLATVDVLSGGRLSLGIGTGWLAEEFEALGVDFRARGRITDDWIALLRSSWTGFPEAFHSDRYTLRADMVALPSPAHRIPLLVGGTSPAAFRRAAHRGDGWIGQQPIDSIDLEELSEQISALRRERPAESAELRVLVRLTGDPNGADESLAALSGLGVHDVIISPPSDLSEAAAVHDRVKALLEG